MEVRRRGILLQGQHSEALQLAGRIDTWWRVNAFVGGNHVHIVNQCLAGVLPAQVAIFWVDLMRSLQAVLQVVGPPPTDQFPGKSSSCATISCLSILRRTIGISIAGPAALQKGPTQRDRPQSPCLVCSFRFGGILPLFLFILSFSYITFFRMDILYMMKLVASGG